MWGTGLLQTRINCIFPLCDPPKRLENLTTLTFKLTKERFGLLKIFILTGKSRILIFVSFFSVRRLDMSTNSSSSSSSNSQPTKSFDYCSKSDKTSKRLVNLIKRIFWTISASSPLSNRKRPNSYKNSLHLPSETAKCSYQYYAQGGGGPRDRVGTLSKNKNLGHLFFCPFSHLLVLVL